MSDPTPSESKAPFLSFPQTLLSEPPLSKEFLYLNDEKVHRELAQEIRATFLKRAAKSQKLASKGGVVLLKGGTSMDSNYYDTDTEIAPFRQESYFQYLFRLNEPDCYGAIFLETGESVLFVPKLPEEVFRWNGPPRTLDYYTKRYGVSKTVYVEDLKKEMADRSAATVYTLKGLNTDSGLTTALIPDMAKLFCNKENDGKMSVKHDDEALHPVLAESRVFKTKREIDFMRMCCRVTSQAHVYVMRHVKPGMSEIQVETMFKAFCGMYGGARHMAYTCICASGSNGSILHYGHAGRPNDRVLTKDDIVVFDMGGEYHGYATDITTSFPISGKFTKEQAQVHSAVQDAQKSVMSQLKPGVSWLEMHRVAERTILKHLLEMGVLKGGSVEELMKHDMASLFMPHGLGHFIGLDTHDVNGYPKGGAKKDNSLGPRWLRTQRILEANMVLTVEPGLYFNDLWIASSIKDDEKKSAFVDQDVLRKYINMGGVRLEDDVVITEDGYENFTVVPKTIKEYQAVVGKYSPVCPPC
mmetsp:Transcript_15035/g.24527  ORF Transcript_15035/g.24527 Transcript_15035/m.24527 type:complete len:527 (+) Transcript_15035:3-1583(+)